MSVSWGYYSQYMESHEIPWFQSTNQLTLISSIFQDACSMKP